MFSCKKGKQVLMKDTSYGLQGNNYVQTIPNKPMDITGPQLNQPMQQYQWKNQQPMFSKSNIFKQSNILFGS